MLNNLVFSVLEQDRAPIVICDLSHTIVYMNNAAHNNYLKWGGKDLVGKSLLDCHNNKSQEAIKKIVDWFCLDTKNNMIYTFRNDKLNKDVYMVALRDDNNTLIGYYEKHEFRNIEKAALYDFSKSLI